MTKEMETKHFVVTFYIDHYLFLILLSGIFTLNHCTKTLHNEIIYAFLFNNIPVKMVNFTEIQINKQESNTITWGEIKLALDFNDNLNNSLF